MISLLDFDRPLKPNVAEPISEQEWAENIDFIADIWRNKWGVEFHESTLKGLNIVASGKCNNAKNSSHSP
jgi:hypothetical protein